MCLHPGALRARIRGVWAAPVATGGRMIRFLGVFLLALPAAAALSAVPAQAQSSPPYYRGSTPPDAYPQDRVGVPSRILPYPNDEADAAPPPPRFATPASRPPAPFGP